MRAKDWLEKEEWENVAVDSQKFSHYTTLDKLLEEYAKVYLKNKLKEIDLDSMTPIEAIKYLDDLKKEHNL